VTYRGILVGSVRSIKVTSSAVVAELEITKGDLRLPLPVTGHHWLWIIAWRRCPGGIDESWQAIAQKCTAAEGR
jgi:hypothetical protein